MTCHRSGCTAGMGKGTEVHTTLQEWRAEVHTTLRKVAVGKGFLQHRRNNQQISEDRVTTSVALHERVILFSP